MAQQINGLNSTQYLGVLATTPPQLIYSQRIPTENDFRLIVVGTLWLQVGQPNNTPISLWMAATVIPFDADWIQLYPSSSSGASTFHTDDGNNATPLMGVINDYGDGGRLLRTTSSGNTINTQFINGSNGQVIIGGDGYPAWATLTPGTGISIANAANMITISSTASAATYQTDTVNTATPIAGVLKLHGDGNVIKTDAPGATNIVTTSLLNGTDGQVIIGGGGAPLWRSLTAGTGITIVPAANSITISSSAAAAQYKTDDGNTAMPVAGVLNVKGGTNINTTNVAPGSDNLFVNLNNSVSLSGTLTLQSNTNGVLQTNGAGLVSATNAANGSVLIGTGIGVAPVWNTITAGTNISVVNTAGHITINSTGSGAGGSILTTFTSSGNWTLHANTKYALIYAIGGGAGGGSGQSGSTNQASGGGGGAASQGSITTIYGPFVGSSAVVPIVIGAGGAGGASVGPGAAVGLKGSGGGATTVGNYITIQSVGSLVAGGPGGGGGLWTITQDAPNPNYLGGSPGNFAYTNVAIGSGTIVVAAGNCIITETSIVGPNINQAKIIGAGLGTAQNTLDGSGNQSNDGFVVCFFNTGQVSYNALYTTSGTWSDNPFIQVGNNLIPPTGGAGGSGVVASAYRGGNSTGYGTFAGGLIAGTFGAGGAANSGAAGNNGATGIDYLTNTGLVGFGSATWGTGGGGGSAGAPAGGNGGNGGNGGLGGGGGGGGGGCASGTGSSSGSGGTGGSGIVITLEFM